MRLLNVKTRRLEEFYGDEMPLYAILSHTWGREEVTFQDLANDDHKQKHGYRKIDGCCQAAHEQRISYVWVDTCCIDKSSSAELSEAINSMFMWYKASKVCFIYLEDVPTGLDPFSPDSAFRKSRWWTRGWTLQELLAPQHMIFFNSTWERVFSPEMDQGLFTRVDLPGRFEEEPDLEMRRPPKRPEVRLQTILEQMRYGLITEITGIPKTVLVKTLPLSKVSAACKFSWAALRLTTRVEDKAYCLMGLLGVNMPLLYGEGDDAFVRLQEKVINSSDDISLLAWGYNLPYEVIEELGYDKVLARSPMAFKRYPKSNHQHLRRPPKAHSTVTGHGLHIELPLLRIDARNRVWIGLVEESSDEDVEDNVSIALVLVQKGKPDTRVFERARGCPVLKLLNFDSRKRIFRGPISQMVYLQDGGSGYTPVPAYSQGGLHMSYLSRLLLTSSMRKSTNQYQYTAELAISMQSIRKLGYMLSSRYPPINHNTISIIFRGFWQPWELMSGQINRKRESPYDYLLCQGPGTELFYFILTNAAGHNIAMRVRITYQPPYIASYSVSLSQCDARRNVTALEYACASEFGTRAAQRLHRTTQWSNHVNLMSLTDAKIHLSAHHAQKNLRHANIGYTECDLVWSGGWVSEDEHGTTYSY
jgi:hypothetical protein